MAKITLSELALQNLIKESIENVLQGGNEDELNEDWNSFKRGLKGGMSGMINGYRSGKALADTDKEHRWQYSRRNPEDSFSSNGNDMDAAKQATENFKMAKEYMATANRLKSNAISLQKQFHLVYDKETQSFAYPQTVPAGTGNSAAGLANRNRSLHGRFRSPGQQATI